MLLIASIVAAGGVAIVWLARRRPKRLARVPARHELRPKDVVSCGSDDWLIEGRVTLRQQTSATDPVLYTLSDRDHFLLSYGEIFSVLKRDEPASLAVSITPAGVEASHAGRRLTLRAGADGIAEIFGAVGALKSAQNLPIVIKVFRAESTHVALIEAGDQRLVLTSVTASGPLDILPHSLLGTAS